MRGKPAGGAVLAAIARPLCQWLHGSAYLTRRRLSCGFLMLLGMQRACAAAYHGDGRRAHHELQGEHAEVMRVPGGAGRPRRRSGRS